MNVEWIPITERMPDNTDDCLVYIPSDGVELAFRLYGDISADTWDSDSGFISGVTHWMPMPPAPL